MGFDQNLPNKAYITFTDGERYDLLSSESNVIRLNAGLRLEVSCTPPVNTVPHGGQVESLWQRNYGRWGLELSAELSDLISPDLIFYGWLGSKHQLTD